MPKRLNYISWDQYFMEIALLSAQRSKDPSTQVGACIVNPKNQIIGVGYNGFCRGCSDDEFPWEPNDVFLESKYTYMVHAEANAIINSINIRELEKSRIYTTIFPCNECAKLITQAGIKEIIYYSKKHFEDDQCWAARIIFKSANITWRQFKF